MTSRSNLVGQIQRPGEKPRNVELTVSRRSEITFFELQAGVEWVNPAYPLTNIRRYADPDNDGDGTNDVSAAVQKAADVGLGIYFPRPRTSWVITSSVTVLKDQKIWGDGMGVSVIQPNLGLTGGKCFAIETDYCHIEDLTLDSTGLTYTPATGNSYGLFLGDGTTTYKQHTVRRVECINLDFASTPVSGVSTIVNHFIYADNVEQVTVEDCVGLGATGAFFFGRDVNNCVVDKNIVKDFGWYNIHFEGGIDGGSISYNEVNCQVAEGAHFGGLINLMSQHSPREGRCNNIDIIGNDVQGITGYTTVFRILSSENITIRDNRLHDLSIGTAATSATDLSYIRVETRGLSATANNGACQNITIENNTCEKPLEGNADVRGIYVGNEYSDAKSVSTCANNGSGLIRVTTTTNHEMATGMKTTISGVVGTTEANGTWLITRVSDTTFDLDNSAFSNTYTSGGTVTQKFYNLKINNNKIWSADTTNYFHSGVHVHGQNGGFEHVDIYDNDIITYRQAASGGFNAALNLTADDADGEITYVHLGGNTLKDLGDASTNNPYGIWIGQYVDYVWNDRPNIIDNFNNGLRTEANSGPELFWLDDNQYLNIGTSDNVFSVALRDYRATLTGSTTWNPGSIADGDEEAQNVTVTGAALGDFVTAVSFSLDVQDLELTGQVTAANTVTCTLSNNTGGSVDLASGTVRVRVNKAGSGE